VQGHDIVLVDAEGQRLAGAHPVEPTAMFIHASVHRIAGKACVMHTHMPYATALTMLEDPELLPALQTSLLFHEQVAHDPDYDGLAFDEAEGDRMASKLGNRSVLFLANHGVIVTGGTVHEAYDRLYYLERACMTQVLAMSTGKRLKMVRPDVARKTAAQMTGAVGHTQQTAHFEALKRLLDKEAPDYRH
jgi:ribulose-5-phosphate 4-epimerase/fuculose-1-phosphate aldolase